MARPLNITNRVAITTARKPSEKGYWLNRKECLLGPITRTLKKVTIIADFDEMTGFLPKSAFVHFVRVAIFDLVLRGLASRNLIPKALNLSSKTQDSTGVLPCYSISVYTLLVLWGWMERKGGHLFTLVASAGSTQQKGVYFDADKINARTESTGFDLSLGAPSGYRAMGYIIW